MGRKTQLFKMTASYCKSSPPVTKKYLKNYADSEYSNFSRNNKDNRLP